MDRKRLSRRARTPEDGSQVSGSSNAQNPFLGKSFGKSMAEARARRNEMLIELESLPMTPSSTASRRQGSTLVRKISGALGDQVPESIRRMSSVASNRRVSTASVGSAVRSKTPAQGLSKAEIKIDFLEEKDRKSYEIIWKEFGLTAEDVMMYHACGSRKETVEKLRSVFTELDKDGGGELGPVEIFEALNSFGQQVTDEDVRKAIAEVDVDGSGSIGFKEFLLLSIPGIMKERPFEVRKSRHTLYEDPFQYDQNPKHTIEIPEQCFAPDLTLADSQSSKKAGAHDGEPDPDDPEPMRFVEFRINFKASVTDSFLRTPSANAGTICAPLCVIEDCWVEKVFYYKDTVHLDRTGMSFILDMTASSQPPPKQKIKFVRNPAISIDIGGLSGPSMSKDVVEGFPVESVDVQGLSIGYKGQDRKANFPLPPASITVVCCGKGSSVPESKKQVALKCFLPPWFPMKFTYRIVSDGNPSKREIELREDFSELDDVARGNVIINVSAETSRSEVESILLYESERFPWIQDICMTGSHPTTYVLSQFILQGASSSLYQRLTILADCSLGICLTDQVVQESNQKNFGWLLCPPHPNVLPVFLTESNVVVCPFVAGISGDLMGQVIKSSVLKATQIRTIHTVIGLQMALALEHMHGVGILHLDLKPGNILVHIDGALHGEDTMGQRLWQRMRILVCDFGNCAAFELCNSQRRGTPGFWSPEQSSFIVKHNASEMLNSYWGGEACVDPPPPRDDPLSEKSDSWGWACTMLFFMGRLDEFRKVGHTALLSSLEQEGRRLNLTNMFLYEQQPYIDALQEELGGIQKQYDQFRNALQHLQDEIEMQKLTILPLWKKAEAELLDLDPADLAQLSGYRRPPPLVRFMSGCIAAVLDIPKNFTEWEKMRQILGDAGTIQKLLSFDRDKGSSMQATRQLIQLTKSESLEPEKMNEKSVPNSDPATKGSSLQACRAYADMILAVMAVNQLRKATGPIQLEARVNENAMNRLRPKIESLQQSLDEETSKLRALQEITLNQSDEVISAVLDHGKAEALELLKSIFQMENTLSDQQYDCLAREVGYCTGEHSLLLNRICGLKCRFEHDADEGSNIIANDDSLLGRYEFLSESHPSRDRALKDISKLYKTLDLGSLKSSSPLVAASVFGHNNRLPAQKQRHLHFGKLRNLCPVGDSLKLILACCLQNKPSDRLSLSGVSMMMMQLAPGQEWLELGSLPGKPPTFLTNTDDSSKMPTTKTSSFERILQVLSLPNDNILQKLLLIERNAITLLKEGEHILARNSFMECLDSYRLFQKDEIHNAEILRLLLRVHLGLCKIWCYLKCFDLAASCHQQANATFLQLFRWMTTGVKEDSINRAVIGDTYTQFDSFIRAGCSNVHHIQMFHRLYADIAACKGYLILERKVDQSGNSSLEEAARSFRLSAELLNSSLGLSLDLAIILQGYAGVREEQGFRAEAKALYEDVLEITAKASGYDAYLGHHSTAQVLESISRIDIILDNYEASIGQLLRSKHIYEATNYQGESGPAIVRVLLTMGKTHKLGENYGKAVSVLHDAQDLCTSLINMPRNCSGARRASLIFQRASIFLELSQYSSAAADFKEALRIFKETLRVPSFSQETTEDHSVFYVADCWNGVGACYEHQSQYWEALECYQKAYHLCLSRVTEHHHCLADIRERMGNVYHKMGKLGIALEWNIGATKSREIAQGAMHPDVGESYLSLSVMYRENNQFNKALSHAKAAMRIFVIAFGQGHRKVAQAIAALVFSSFPLSLKVLRAKISWREKVQACADSSHAEHEQCKLRLIESAETLLIAKKRTPVRKIDVLVAEEECERWNNASRRAETKWEQACGLVTDADTQVDKAVDGVHSILSLLATCEEIIKKIKQMPQNIALLKKVQDADITFRDALQTALTETSLLPVQIDADHEPQEDYRSLLCSIGPRRLAGPPEDVVEHNFERLLSDSIVESQEEGTNSAT